MLSRDDSIGHGRILTRRQPCSVAPARSKEKDEETKAFLQHHFKPATLKLDSRYQDLNKKKKKKKLKSCTVDSSQAKTLKCENFDAPICKVWAHLNIVA